MTLNMYYAFVMRIQCSTTHNKLTTGQVGADIVMGPNLPRASQHGAGGEGKGAYKELQHLWCKPHGRQ